MDAFENHERSDSPQLSKLAEASYSFSLEESRLGLCCVPPMKMLFFIKITLFHALPLVNHESQVLA